MGGVYGIAPLDEERVEKKKKTKIVIVYAESGEISRIFTSHFSKTDYIRDVFTVKNQVVLYTNDGINILELKYGKQIADVELKNIYQVIADEKGEKLFIAVVGEFVNDGEHFTYSEKNKENRAGIYSYVIKNEKTERISKRATEKMTLIYRV